MHTKLTGAGGGGCAVTLVPDSAYRNALLIVVIMSDMTMFPIDVPEDKLHDLMNDLRNDGFEPYLTSVGGSGVGILSPYRAQVRPKPATPPETPNESEEDEKLIGVQPGSGEPLRSTFESKLSSDLSHWAEGQGRWLYV